MSYKEKDKVSIFKHQHKGEKGHEEKTDRYTHELWERPRVYQHKGQRRGTNKKVGDVSSVLVCSRLQRGLLADVLYRLLC